MLGCNKIIVAFISYLTNSVIIEVFTPYEALLAIFNKDCLCPPHHCLSQFQDVRDGVELGDEQAQKIMCIQTDTA